MSQKVKGSRPGRGGNETSDQFAVEGNCNSEYVAGYLTYSKLYETKVENFDRLVIIDLLRDAGTMSEEQLQVESNIRKSDFVTVIGRMRRAYRGYLTTWVDRGIRYYRLNEKFQLRGRRP